MEGKVPIYIIIIVIVLILILIVVLASYQDTSERSSVKSSKSQSFDRFGDLPDSGPGRVKRGFF
jgi:NADH:ubiquinone oxidoreductase subunit 3 (subunit A)